MKTKILMLAIVAMAACVNCKGQSKPDKQLISKHNKIKLFYAKGMDAEAPDTLLINSKKYFVLAGGSSTSCYGVSGKKWEWTIQDWVIVDSKNGRALHNGYWQDRFDAHVDQKGNLLYLVRILDGEAIKIYK